MILAGGAGFLGRTLAKWNAKRDVETVILSRSATPIDGARVVEWDGRTLGAWASELEGAAALVNLAGRSVNCRYTTKNRRQMIDSRVLSTRVLGEAVRSCATPPAVWLNSSTATIYRHTFGPAHDESGEIGAAAEANDAFSVEIAQAWEAEFAKAIAPRKIVLRTAMVLGREPGGVLEVLRRLAKCWMGGRMGRGDQYVSWIHEEDFCRVIDWLIASPQAQGVYNLSSPAPLTNGEMMAAMRRPCGRWLGLPAARWMLEVGAFFLRTETELILKSRRVVPGRLIQEGFRFSHPELEGALTGLV